MTRQTTISLATLISVCSALVGEIGFYFVAKGEMEEDIEKEVKAAVKLTELKGRIKKLEEAKWLNDTR